MERQKKLKEAVAKVGETRHHQYMICYYPFSEGTEGKWRRIQVKLPQPTVVSHYEFTRAAGTMPSPADPHHWLGAFQGCFACSWGNPKGTGSVLYEKRPIGREPNGNGV